MKRILIVEDEQLMLDLYKIQLKNEFILTLAKDGAEALEYVHTKIFDLILLDVMVPYVDGWTLCREIRSLSNTPILMITARTNVEDRVKGLQLGADDYLVKPFEFNELKARIMALLRRSSMNDLQQQENEIIYEDFRLDLSARTVNIGEKKLDLTQKEFELLKLLASSPNQAFAREDLIQLLWHHEEERDGRAVDSHIKNIRLKVKQVAPHLKLIRTVWGLGYQFVIPEERL